MAALGLPFLLFATAMTLPPPPTTRRAPVADTLHGVKLTDPYRWLEESTEETRAWAKAQNDYTQAILTKLPGRAALEKRVAELLKTDAATLPSQHGGRLFFRRRAAGAEQHRIVVREADDAERVLVDPAQIDANPNTSVAIAAVSHDGKLLAYGVQRGGKDEQEIRFLDVDTGRAIADKIPEGRWISYTFSHDRRRFFYTTSGSADPRVRVHTLGTPSSSDTDVFGAGYGQQHLLAAGVSHDGRWLVITVYHGSSADVTEIHVQSLEGAAGQPVRAIATAELKASFFGDVIGGRLIAMTNRGAPKWRVVSIDLNQPGEPHWRELVPEGKLAIDSFKLAGGRIVLGYLNNVRSELKVYDAATGRHERDIPLPGPGSVTGVSGDWGSRAVFYQFTSLHTPLAIYRFDLVKNSQDAWYRPSLPVVPENYEVWQEWCTSKDGTKVPMFLMSKKGARRGVSRPTILTAYGGFNSSMLASFLPTAMAWVDQGGLWVLANLRGGAEFGEEWHRAGMLANKQNVFDDFIAAAEHLIAAKYTTPKKLVIRGGSNGGLLVGAAMTQRPELFAAVWCEVPLLDMIRYHQFLVARFWIPEYGSSDDPAQFRYLLKYSPYHNVKAGTKYPALLLVTGESDTRVAPLHARKMAALMQSATRGGPVLLHYDSEAGHSVGLGVTKMARDAADKLMFALWQTGALPAPQAK